MKIIVGLGNPGTKYEHTRHNVGFLAIDYYITSLRNEDARWEKKFQSEILEHRFSKNSDNSESIRSFGSVIFVKPQTYMNNSGQAVKEICDFYKASPARDLLVIHDEIDLPFGGIRAANSSSSAGHNGVQDIIDRLGTKDFQRVRVGVETRPSRNGLPTDVFVLQNFSADEMAELDKNIFPAVKLEIEKFLGNY